MEHHIPSVKLEGKMALSLNVSEQERLDKMLHPHRLELSCLLIVTEGEAEITVNLFRYHIRRNNIVVALYGSVVQLTGRSDDFKVEVIAFSPEFVTDIDLVKNLLPHLEMVRNHAVLSLADYHFQLIMEFYTLFAKVYKRMDENQTENPQVFRHLLISFFYSVIAIYDQGKVKSDLKPPSRQEKITSDLMTLVVKHYREERTIGFYAEKLNITTKHLSLTVRKVTGKTVSEIIADAVILDAKAQLKTLDLSIQEISDSLHFADQSFFGKYFKRHTGLSPKSYREKYQL
ncbi:MAG: helix-turn-helix domain-containing protein [Tannerellaceae bacterium]|nr:helix-turn-helix domain-containing protein [Tannerellaceae bacterium]